MAGKLPSVRGQTCVPIHGRRYSRMDGDSLARRSYVSGLRGIAYDPYKDARAYTESERQLSSVLQKLSVPKQKVHAAKSQVIEVVV